MTSNNLIETLTRVGYPGVDGIDAHALDWAFENESTRPFLEWFCHSINEQNVLTEEEIRSYAELQASGNAISGAHLDDALAQMSYLKESHGSEHLRSNLDQLNQSLKRNKEKRASLIKTNKMLDIKQFSVNSKTSKMEKVLEEENNSYRASVERCHKQNSLNSIALEKLASSVNKLIAFYDTASQNAASVEERRAKLVFLSQTGLQDYHEAEEQFSRDLTAFTKKRFFEGIVDMSGQRDSTHYDIVDITSLKNISSSQSEKDDFEEDCLEFSRLQQVFPQSEVDRINALVNVKKAVSAVQEAKTILHHLKTGQFPVNPSDISQCQKRAEENICKTEAESSGLVTGITDLIKQLGGLQGTEILTGDYDLKLKRQEYFTSSQDKLIEYLVEQRSRSDFLALMYEMELKSHQDIHHLLSAVEQILQKHLEEWKQCMTDLDDPDLSVAKLGRGVVDTRDLSSARLYKMMENSTETAQKHYLPVSKVKETSNKFYNSCESAKKLDETMQAGNWNKMLELEGCVDECEATLYHGSSTSSGSPSLSPANVQAAYSSLKSAVTSLLKEIENVIGDVTAKKKSLKGNPFQEKERELFTLFHTKPERLQTIVGGLAEKLKILEMAQE